MWCVFSENQRLYGMKEHQIESGLPTRVADVSAGLAAMTALIRQTVVC